MQILNALFFIALISPALAADPLIVALTLNGVAQGDVPALYDNGEYWIAGSALNGLEGDTQNVIQFEGENYYAINSLKGLHSRFDPAQLSLELTADAGHFGENEIKLSHDPSQLYAAPTPLSWYLNYQLSLRKQSQTRGVDFQFNPTLNINHGYLNLRSEQSFNHQPDQSEWRRINTLLTYDVPQSMLRFSVGDIIPTTGPLGQSQAMAGIGVARVFAMQPDLNTSPSAQFQAPVTQPSTADIYLNGQQISSQNLQPGVYNFNDLSYYTGLQDVEIVIRDSSGHTQRYRTPYYFDDSLLKAGLSEFNYNVGVARQNGSFNTYQGLTYSGYQRFGLTDWLTLGAQASGQSNQRRVGVLANIGLGTYGTLGSASSWAKHAGQNSGSAQVLQYRFVNQAFSIAANARRQSPHFLAKNSLFAELSAPDWSTDLGVSWGRSDLGNVSLNIGRQRGKNEQQTFTRYQVGYSISPIRSVAISTQLQLQQFAKQRQFSGFINLSWYFGQGSSLYLSNRTQDGRYLTSGNLSQSTPQGQGWGYNIGVQQQEQGTDYSAWLQNKQSLGQIELSFQQNKQLNQSINNGQITWSSALAYSGGHYALTRPINQSFAVAQLLDIPDVAVLQNGNAIATTNSEGIAFLPDLANNSWQQISVDQSQIPLHYSLPQLRKDVLTGNYNAQKIVFSAREIAAVTGQLQQQDGQALANRRVTIGNAKHQIEVQTALDGYFYTEDLPAGKYTFQTNNCTGTLEVPASQAIVNEISPSICKESL
ncbi:fimbria/pilus outer membrane usher protein [uncultured Deefgea sp.]|uniref:fimbria/pilus outer membrane usher protein n=1 Tax=uncultured Deefgea sp. TaxID=1304914 RepID=UPI00261EBC43|nr:fimbria/pilus outer membrane usher protein [uncultured Deefgea sp.]